MAARYVLSNNTYDIRKCVEADISNHYEVIRHLVDDVPEETYKNSMLKSVLQGYAYCVEKNAVLVGFIYNMCNTTRYGEAVSIWGNDVIAFTVMLKEAFEQFPVHKIKVVPHKENVLYLRSLVKPDSIRNWYNYKTSLVIVIAPLIDKFKKMYLQLGITKVEDNV